MRKLTILEGPDGAGKTTLAKSPKYKDQEYIHYGPPPKGRHGAWYQYMALLKALWEEPEGPDVIIDRFIYGEVVYGPLLRGGTDLTWPHIKMLERVLLAMNAELIICLPPWEDVYANWDRRRDQELLKTEEDLHAVYKFYQAMLSISDLNRSIYDYTDYRDQYSVGRSPWGNTSHLGPGIGCWNPGYSSLLVGEMVNTKTGYEGWPFVSHTGCSPWLTQLLLEAGIPENSLYWINSMDQDKNPTDARFIDKLQPRQIIALGNKARDWCIDQGIKDFSMVPHPQAHKRFNSGEPYPLIEILTNG